MSRQFYKFRAPTLTEAYVRVRRALGEDARIVNTVTVKQGGIFGWFARDVIEVTAAPPTTPKPTNAAERKYRTAGAPPVKNAMPAAAETASPDRLRYFEDLIRDAQRRMQPEVASSPEPTPIPAPLMQKTPSSAHTGAAAGPVGAFFSARIGDTPPENTPEGVRAAVGAPVTAPPQPASVLQFPKRNELENTADPLRRELQELREMVQVLYAEQPGAGLPVDFAPYYRDLIHRGVSRRAAAALVRSTLRNSDPVLMRNPRIFGERLRLEIRRLVRTTGGIALPLGECRVVALCGTTGVGKTTTLAKLAAHFAVHQRARVGLITIDTYRVAAPEQLRVYANIIGLPLRVAHDEKDLQAALDAFKDLDLVLVDTAGGSQFNLEQTHELQHMLITARPHETLLVMAANTPVDDLRNVVANFTCLRPTATIFTKTDETRQHGGLLSLLLETGLPLAYLCTGQNVPDDIQIATPGGLAGLVMEGKYRE